MVANYVTYRGHRYKLKGALVELFGHQLELTGYGGFEEGEEAWITAARQASRERRDEWIQAIPPRLRWWLIEAGLDAAKAAALAQEGR